MQDKAAEYAQSVLSARQARAFQLSQEKREALHKEYPKLAELNSRISLAGAQAAKCALAGGDPSNYEKMVEQAVAELERYTRANGIDTNIDCHYCKLCGDTGYTENGMQCACLRELKKEYASSRINDDSPLELCSFESFSLDYYSDEKPKSSKLSVRDIMSRNLQICRDFSKSAVHSGSNLLLMGGAGLGKTHLALSIASVMLNDGYNVVYCSAASIFKQIESEYFAQKSRETLDSLKDCEVLILDDLGAEYITPFVVSVIYDLVNTRINEKRPTVYTSNITDETRLEMRYGEAVASRLRGCCTLLPFVGEDVRLQKNTGRTFA